MAESENPCVVLETSKGIFRLIDEAHINLGIPETAHIPEIRERFATGEQVVTQLDMLNKFEAPDPNGIQMAIVRPLAGLPAVSITQLYNASLRKGNVPEEWKTAIEMETYMGGHRRRPMSLAWVMRKQI